ncbi:phage terminase small subunit [Enterococcus faecium 1,231,502]|nr:phage terminase small subunit [Enterococcus faecium 1,231,502]
MRHLENPAGAIHQKSGLKYKLADREESQVSTWLCSLSTGRNTLKGGDDCGNQRKKINPDSHEEAGGKSGQSPTQCKRVNAGKEGTDLSEVAGTRGKEGMEASGKADGGHRNLDRCGYGCLCRLVPSLRPLEGSRGIHYPARYHRENPIRLLAAGTTGVYCPDLSENYEPIFRAVRSDAFVQKPYHCR